MKRRDIRKGCRVQHTWCAKNLPGYPAHGVIAGKPHRPESIRVMRDGTKTVESYWHGFWTKERP